jgi:hypothetical protein
MSSKELWLTAPDGQFADDLKWIIKEWSDEPTSAQLLKALDWAAYCGGASTFAMQCLNVELDMALKNEGTTMEQLELTGLLTWRNESPFTD